MTRDPWNAHGLVDGSVPAGKPCPFAEGCEARTDFCPTPEHLLEWPFSCARARLVSLITPEGSEVSRGS